MTDRPSIPLGMKLDALFLRGMVRCIICKEVIATRAECQWHHVHEVILDGPNEADNIGPVHADPCHKKATARLARDLGHIRRLTGANKPKPKTTWAKRPFPKSRGFEPRRSA